MSGEPNLEELISAARKRVDQSHLAPEVKAARQKEMLRRNNVATAMATKAIRRLHSDDYQSLMDQAKAKVTAKFGPLPGDGVSS